MTNKKTFTKIRKWAEAKGFEVKDSNYFDEITVYVSEDLSFTIANKESTIYRSVRGGLKGNPKGMYMSVNNIENRRYGHSFQYRSQNDMIERMEEELEELETTNTLEVSEEVDAEVTEVETTETVEEVVVTEENQTNEEKEESNSMTILTDRKDIAKALNFGKYPVLTFDLDNNKGSKVRVRSRNGEYFHKCELFKDQITKGDGIMYLLTTSSVMSSSFSINDCLNMAEYANAPIIESNQEVAIVFHSKLANVYFVRIMKTGRVDGSYATAATFEDIDFMEWRQLNGQ